MSIVRINEFQAREGEADSLWELMKEVKKIVLSNEGALGCQVLQNQEKPSEILVIEQWASIDAHHTAAQKIPTHLFEQAMKLLSQRPTGAYYHE